MFLPPANYFFSELEAVEEVVDAGAGAVDEPDPLDAGAEGLSLPEEEVESDDAPADAPASPLLSPFLADRLALP